METQILPPDYIQLLFSNLDEMLHIHSQFNNLLKVKRRDSPVVGEIADVLLSMVRERERVRVRAHARACVRVGARDLE